MFCTKCGVELPEGTVFCTSCGAKQEQASVETETLQGQGTKEKKTTKKWNLKRMIPVKRGTSLSGKTGKNRKVMAGCVAGVAVIAVIAGAVVLNQPKIKLMRSAYKTYRDMVKTESEFESYLGLKGIQKELKNGATHQEVTFSGKQEGERIGIRAVINQDKKNQEMGILAYPMYKNSDLIEVLLYRNKEKTVFAVPDLYDGSFYFNNEDVFKNFRESALNSYIKQWTGEHGGEESLDDEDQAKLKGLADRFMEQSSDTWKQMGKNITVEKIGKKNFTIAGKSKKCVGYEVTVSKKDMKNVLKEVTKFVGKDDSIKSLFTSLPRMGEQEFEYFLTEFEDGISELENSLEDDLVVTLYTGPKGRLVSMEWEHEFAFSRYEMPVELTVSFLGARNPLDQVEVEFDYTEHINREDGSTASDRYTISLLREKTYNKSSKQLDDTGEFTVKNIYGESVDTTKYSYGFGLNEKSGAWDLTLKEDDNTIKAEGTFSDIKKGKSFTLVLDKLKFDNPYQQSGPTFEGQYMVGALGKEPVNVIPADLGDEIDLFDMGISEVQKIGKNVLKKLTAKVAKAGLETVMDSVFGGSSKTEATTAAETTEEYSN